MSLKSFVENAKGKQGKIMHFQGECGILLVSLPAVQIKKTVA